MRVLLVVSGLREPEMEIPNDIKNTKWVMAGEYDSDGLFKLRKGEHTLLQLHFKLLRINRLHQKKALVNIEKPSRFEEPTFEPKVLNKSKAMADKWRSKRMNGQQNVDVVTVLLNRPTQKK
jgi:hypothetical protein